MMTWLDRCPAWRSAVLVLGVMLAIYIPTGSYQGAHSVDTVLTSMSASTVAQEGSLDLTNSVTQIKRTAALQSHLVSVDGHLYTNRFPGAIAVGVPFYAAARWLGAREPSWGALIAPGVVAGATLTALAMMVLHLVLRRVVAPHIATAGAIAYGLGTASWSVSANALWTHGPSQLWLACGMLALASGAYAKSGMAWGLALLTRPHLGVVAAVVGVHESWRSRTLPPAFLVATTTAIGLAAWFLYGRLVFGQWSLLGGYAPRGHVAESIASQTVAGWAVNLWWMLVHPIRGVLPYSLFLVPLSRGIPDAWRQGPRWVRSSALGGVAYLLVQAYINRWSGGDAYWGYRYQIETMTLLAPLFLIAFVELDPRGRRAAIVGMATAISLQFPGALLEVLL